MGIANAASIATALTVAYLCYMISIFYQMGNPMSGVSQDELSGPLLSPAWKIGDVFCISCSLGILSEEKRQNQVSELKHAIKIWKSEPITLDNSSSSLDLVYDMLFVDNDFSQAPVNTTTVKLSDTYWKRLRSSKRDIVFDVSVSLSSSKTIQSTSTSNIQSTIPLLKQDVRPKSLNVRYLLSDFGLVSPHDDGYIVPEYSNLSEGGLITFWKPKVSVRIVNDQTQFPRSRIHPMLSSSIRKTEQGLVYLPPLHVDEIGLTSELYLPMNSTVSRLPLSIHVSYFSLSRWLIMRQMERSLNELKSSSGNSSSDMPSFGFTDEDIDDVRRLISDTHIVLLAVTIIASTFHLLFEFLAIKSDISFWQNNKSLTGLSIRSLVIQLFCQIVVSLYLWDNKTSLLVAVPAVLSVGIQVWKIVRATGMCIEFSPKFCIRLPRLEDADPCSMARLTLDTDAFATNNLGLVFLPLSLGFSIYSLIYSQHKSWYSYTISSTTGCIYTFGFILMVPQLLINYKLKSVEHMPWANLCFKFFNTIIDDLFAFVIRMPIMHRISCFRDDVIFIVYVYQRYIYPVDLARRSVAVVEASKSEQTHDDCDKDK